MQGLAVAELGYTRHWRWVCPTDELDHGRLDTTEEQPPPVCSCGETMVDGAIFTDRSKMPPFLSSGGWVWNEARGVKGYWERFDPEKTALVSRAELETLAKVIASARRDNDYRGNTILVAAAQTIERLMHPKFTLRVGGVVIDPDE